MKNLITCLAVSLISGVAFADTWTVDDDGKADFNNIQAAVDVASNGDEIVVMPGTYTSTADEVVDMRGKEIWLHSSKGAEVTIIDGEGTRRGIHCQDGETANTIIEGFTFTNNTANYGGGGMRNSNSNPTLTNCTFTNNTCNDKGGGMGNWQSNPTLENCTFTGNTATNAGGGMYNYGNSSPILTDCRFTDNSAYYGGGMSIDSGSPTLTDCTFTDNTADYGGGIYNNLFSSPSLINCLFESNNAEGSGGGMYNQTGDVILTNTTVCGNTPDQIYGGWTEDGSNTITNICSCPPDVNGDGIVGLNDILILLGNFGSNTKTGDVNEDGIVDVIDLLLVVDNWGPCE